MLDKLETNKTLLVFIDPMLHEVNQFLDDLIFLTLIGSVLALVGILLQRKSNRLKHIPFIKGFSWYLQLFSFILVWAGLLLSLFILAYRTTTSEDLAADTIMMSTNLILLICSLLAAALFAAMSCYLLRCQKTDRERLSEMRKENGRLRNNNRQLREHWEPDALTLVDLREHLLDSDQDLVDPRELLDLIDESMERHKTEVRRQTRKAKGK